MTIVKTFLKETKHKGIGLFAGQFILKGTTWWIETPDFDKVVTTDEYFAASGIEREFYDTYMFVKTDGTMYVCVDNARFINHSNNPNTTNNGNDCVTVRDIKQGEELTCDYREICDWCKDDLKFENKE